jgi:dihydroneopterin aldolase
MGDCIDLEGIRVFAHHGVYENEKQRGQVFLIDVHLAMDLRKPGMSDDLEDTIHYGKLADSIVERASGERWDLIERVAERTAELVLEDPRVESVRVTVHKPEVTLPTPVAAVSVTVLRDRSHR